MLAFNQMKCILVIMTANNKQITAAIKEVMKDTNCTKIEAISGLQSAAAKLGNEDLIEKLFEMKWKIIESM